MKKLLASATVAGLMTGGLLATGAAGTAFAAAKDKDDGTEQQAERQGRHGIRRVALTTAVAAAAEAIGVSVDELKAGVPDGSTIAEYAASKDVPLDTVTDAVVAALTEKIDQAVADGKVTAERAATAKERLPELAEKFVNHERGSRMRGTSDTPDA